MKISQTPICSDVLRIWKKERKPAEEQAEGQTLEEKMALLEKSYELAARYNGKEPDASSTTNAPNSRKERTAVRL